jgi:Deoxynucleoside kinase
MSHATKAKWPEKYRYIAVEGPIGAGKTTLARALAERIAATVLLEDPGANPFLPGFYQDSARYALPTQLFSVSTGESGARSESGRHVQPPDGRRFHPRQGCAVREPDAQ